MQSSGVNIHPTLLQTEVVNLPSLLAPIDTLKIWRLKRMKSGT